jgi:membrane-bound serine protease (ClpP class)
METMLLIGIGLIAMGVLLLVLEAFVPSAGILSFLAVGCTITGIVFLFRYDTMWGWIGLLSSLVLGPAAFAGALNILPNTPLGRTMFGPSGEEIAEQDQASKTAIRQAREALSGKVGMALTDMRPSGVIEIEGKRHDAIATGGVVDRGSAVRVVRVSGLTIEVRRVNDQA